MGGANTGEALGLGFNHRSERISPQGTLLLKMRTDGEQFVLRDGLAKECCIYRASFGVGLA
jgi:hypothetical protein